MPAIALVVVDLRASGAALSAVRTAAVRDWLESRSRPVARTAGRSATSSLPSSFVVDWPGWAGFLYLIRFGNITVTAAQGLELQVDCRGGGRRGQHLWADRARCSARCSACVLIEILQQSLLRWSGLSEFAKDAILGLLILIAITVDALLLGRLREAWVVSRRREKAQARLALSPEGTPDANG